jgi:hypothetical protein
MVKSSSRTTGNDKPADPGGTRPAKKPAAKTVATKVKSGDRNTSPAKSGTRIAK